jgi:hypothetical protein
MASIFIKKLKFYNNMNEKWNQDDEFIVKEWADISKSYIYMHDQSFRLYNKLWLSFMLPIIFISSISSIANFSQSSIPVEYITLVSSVIGGFNIMSALITTILQFLKISETKESHRYASHGWSKFHRNITIELARSPDERTNKLKFFENFRNEYERLLDMAPTIPKKYINNFKSAYSSLDNFNMPDIVGKIRPTLIYQQKKSIREVDLPKTDIVNNV